MGLQSLIHQKEGNSWMHEGNIKIQLEHHHKECYGWALHCCNQDKEMAYDVVQASYLKMLERQNTFRRKSAFQTWAFSVIRNTAFDALRKRKRETMFFQSVENGSLPDTGYDAEVENEFDNKLEKLFFAKALGQLSERQRQIMQLVFYHDLSLNESAAVLRISSGSVRKHYDRAKKTLADWFQKKGVSELY
jgi:RNA polymerase sigma factor (sigma-70 family)